MSIFESIERIRALASETRPAVETLEEKRKRIEDELVWWDRYQIFLSMIDNSDPDQFMTFAEYKSASIAAEVENAQKVWGGE